MSFKLVTLEDLFKCRKCGTCCKGYGGTYVSRADIDAIAGYIGTNPGQFAVDYCRQSGKRAVLAQRSDGYCIFWDRLCTLHAVKPRMCQAWPFIESIIVDPTNWLIMADLCPGIRTDVPLHIVKEYVQKKLSTDPMTQNSELFLGS